MGIDTMERRQRIVEYLSVNRESTAEKLAEQFHVSERTIRYDIENLTRFYPIDTVCGRYGGGIHMANWYRIGVRLMSREQTEMLQRICPALDDADQKVMQTILRDFARSA